MVGWRPEASARCALIPPSNDGVRADADLAGPSATTRSPRLVIPTPDPNVRVLEPTLDDDIRRFVRLHGLDGAIETSRELANDSFPGCAITIALESDPDAGDEWLVVEVSVHDIDEAEIIARFDEFMRAWIVAMPPEKRDHVALTYLVR